MRRDISPQEHSLVSSLSKQLREFELDQLSWARPMGACIFRAGSVAWSGWGDLHAG